MPKTTTLRDGNYSRGMNSLDDPKALSEGECAELINAFPDYPLRLRKGCDGRVIIDGGRYGILVRQKPFCVGMPDGGQCIFFWASISPEVFLFVARVDTYGDFVDVSKVGHIYNPVQNIYVYQGDTRINESVSFVVVGDIIYTRIYRQAGVSMFALEYQPASGNYLGREVPGADFDTGLTLAPAGSVSAAPVDGGLFTGNFAFGYSLTFVRRIAPGVPLDAYVPGLIETPEVFNARGYVISENLPADTHLDILLQQASLWSPPADYGFTHVRIYRTDNVYGGLPGETEGSIIPFPDAHDERVRFIDGAPRKFCFDVPIEQWGNVIKDTVSDAAMMGEMNLMTADQYTLPPTDGYRMLYFKNRLFLLGALGQVYFSEIPGGDGGGDLEFAQTEYGKYALWFKPLHYRLELDVEDRTPATGLIGFGDDLFLFKVNKSYMVIGGDPVLAPLRHISDNVGCLYGDTLISVKVSGRDVVFFMSALGPALIQDGGHISMFDEFKVAELWPGDSGELVEMVGYRGLAQWCTAAFWNDAIWLFFVPHPDATVLKIFAYVSTGETAGIFSVKIAEFAPPCTVLSIVVTPNNKALSIANMMPADARGGDVAIVDFLGSDQSEDTITQADGSVGRARVTFEVLSRKIYPGPKEMSISELYNFIGYCKFREDPRIGSPFKIELMSNRHKWERDFYSEGRKFTSNQLGAPIPGRLEGTEFVRGDGGAWKADALTDYVAYLYREGSPHDGVFVDVRGNSQGALILEDVAYAAILTEDERFIITEDAGLILVREIEVQFDYVRLIGRPVTRLNITATPRAGFVGEYFQYRLTKAIPRNREMDWYGAELQVLPRPHFDRSESMFGGGELCNSWEES